MIGIGSQNDMVRDVMAVSLRLLNIDNVRQG